MKDKKFSISIPNPCNQDWEDMRLTDRGRFCENCNKEVIDFNTFTSTEIANFFAKYKNVCGRFSEDKLDIVYSPTPYKPSYFNFYRLSLLFASLVPLSSFSKTTDPNYYIEENIHNDTSVRIFKGKIKDTKGDGIAKVKVKIVGTTFAVWTNVDGFFKIIVPDSIKIRSKLKLELTHVTFKRKLIEFDVKRLEAGVEIFVIPDNVACEEVEITGYARTKTRDITGGAILVKNSDSSNALQIIHPLVGVNSDRDTRKKFRLFYKIAKLFIAK